MMAVLPERLARAHADRLHIMKIPFELPPFTIAEVWHERTHRDPARTWLRQALADLMEKDGGTPMPRIPRPHKRSRRGDRRATQAV